MPLLLLLEGTFCKLITSSVNALTPVFLILKGKVELSDSQEF